MALATAPVTLPVSIDADGIARVGGTRITLDIVIGAFMRGDTPDEIVRGYDALSLADVYGAITYYLLHTDEVDEYLRVRHARAEEALRLVESRTDHAAIRERLLKRAANLPPF